MALNYWLSYLAPPLVTDPAGGIMGSSWAGFGLNSNGLELSEENDSTNQGPNLFFHWLVN